MKTQIKSGLGALRKTAAAIKDEGQLMSEIGKVVEDCLKDPTTALAKFTNFIENRRRAKNVGPEEGFVRVNVDGEVVLLTSAEAQEFIDESEGGASQERRIAAQMKRVLHCEPQELFAEGVFVRMLIEATLDRYRSDTENDDSFEAKQLKELISSVDTRLKRRMTVLDGDHNRLEETEKEVSTHRKDSGMDAFERSLQDFQQARAKGDAATFQRLANDIQNSRNAYERATNAIGPSTRTCKIARRDIQVHISVFLRYLEALVHKRKEALVSSLSQLRSSVESSGGAESPELSQQLEQLQSIEQQEQFVSKQAREADAVAAAVTAAEGLPPSTPQADVDEIMGAAGVKAMQRASAEPAKPAKAEPEVKPKSQGMHIQR